MLPGIGPLAAIAMLLPLTFNLTAGRCAHHAGRASITAAKYGGSTTAIMVKLPGESASVVTCLDGYEMAKQGRAGPALAHGGDRVVHRRHHRHDVDRLFGPPLAEVALQFGAPEYFSLMVFSLIGARCWPTARMLKALAMIVLGLLLGIVGTDVNSGMSRFTFGVPGSPTASASSVIAMGLFGFAEIVSNLEQRRARRATCCSRR